jgi:hypothetical protein
MGVIDLYFVGNEVEVRYQREVVDCAYIISSSSSSSSSSLCQLLS